MSDSFLTALNWRTATKAFDPSKKVAEADLQKVLEAVRFAPSSFGLQPYHIYVITDNDLRQKIQEVAWNQPQVTNASHLLVFCSRNDTGENRIDAYLETATGGDATAKASMKEYTEMMRGAFAGKSAEQQKIWADRQAYIALGFAMAACAELKIDSCPMEGFTPEKVDELLELPEYLKSVVLLPIGYRASDPEYPKVRFPEKDLFTFVK